MGCLQNYTSVAYTPWLEQSCSAADSGSILIQAQVRDITVNELVRQGAEPDRLIATPTPFNLVLWRVVAMAPDGYREGYYSLLDPSPEIRFVHYPSNEGLLTSIEDARAVERLRAAGRANASPWETSPSTTLTSERYVVIEALDRWAIAPLIGRRFRWRRFLLLGRVG